MSRKSEDSEDSSSSSVPRTSSAGNMSSNEVRLTVDDGTPIQRTISGDVVSSRGRQSARLRSRTLNVGALMNRESDVPSWGGLRFFIAQQHEREHEQELSEMHRRLFFKSVATGFSDLEHLHEGEKTFDEERVVTQRESLSEDILAGVEQLRELFISGCVLLDLRLYETGAIADELLKGILEVGGINMTQKREASETVSKYDERFTEAMNHSYTIIFGSVSGLSKPVLGFTRLRSAVNYDARDGSLTKFIFLVLCDADEEAHKALVPLVDSINLIMEDEDFHSEAWTAENQGALVAALDRFCESIVEEEKEGKEKREEGPLTWTMDMPKVVF